MQTTTTIVNLNPLRKLLRDNKSAIKKALELFVETTVEDMKLMGQHINDRKMLEASMIAHALKSRFVYLGNEDAIVNVVMLEGLLKDGRSSCYPETKNLFEKLNKMIDFCLMELDSEIVSLND